MFIFEYDYNDVGYISLMHKSCMINMNVLNYLKENIDI